MHLEDLTFAQLRDLADITVVVAAAHEAGLFRALGKRPATPDELAEGLALDPRATRVVLLALEEAGLLERAEDGRFGPTTRCRAELCDEGGEKYVGGGLPLWLNSLRSWTRLGEVLRNGGPLRRRTGPRSPEEVERFMAGMAAAPAARVDRIADMCLRQCPDARNVLDVGGGPGHMLRRFAGRGLACTLFDTPDIVAHVVPAYGLDKVEGLTVAVGDFTTDPLPEGPFDLVLLSNVLHIYGPVSIRALLRKVAGVTRAGGTVAIHEFLGGRSGRAARFGIQMLVRSDEGNAYSEEDFTGWLAEAGFERVRVEDVDPDRQLLFAARR